MDVRSSRSKTPPSSNNALTSNIRKFNPLAPLFSKARSKAVFQICSPTSGSFRLTVHPTRVMNRHD